MELYLDPHREREEKTNPMVKTAPSVHNKRIPIPQILLWESLEIPRSPSMPSPGSYTYSIAQPQTVLAVQQGRFILIDRYNLAESYSFFISNFSVQFNSVGMH